MTNEEILEKAIEKALKNGSDFSELITYKRQDIRFGKIYVGVGKLLGETKIVVKSSFPSGEFEPEVKTILFDYEPFIFSHDFAKAFWFGIMTTGVENLSSTNRTVEFEKAWQFHLQQMVLEEDPIKYLEKFI